MSPDVFTPKFLISYCLVVMLVLFVNTVKTEWYRGLEESCTAACIRYNGKALSVTQCVIYLAEF